MTLNLIQDGYTVALKCYHGWYFYYDNNNYPTVTSTLSHECYFNVKKINNYFHFFDYKKRQLCISNSNDTNIIVTEYTNASQNGYSLQGSNSGQFLGISSNGQALIYNDANGWESRWFPAVIDYGKNLF